MIAQLLNLQQGRRGGLAQSLPQGVAGAQCQKLL